MWFQGHGQEGVLECGLLLISWHLLPMKGLIPSCFAAVALILRFVFMLKILLQHRKCLPLHAHGMVGCTDGELKRPRLVWQNRFTPHLAIYYDYIRHLRIFNSGMLFLKAQSPAMWFAEALIQKLLGFSRQGERYLKPSMGCFWAWGLVWQVKYLRKKVLEHLREWKKYEKLTVPFRMSKNVTFSLMNPSHLLSWDGEF